MNQEYTFSKLSDIRTQIGTSQSQSFSVGGLIIDCTSAHRKDQRKDYSMRLKIIQPNTNIVCVVFLFAKSLGDFPKTIKIGDILILHKYNFEIFNDALQAKKPFKTHGQFFRFFSGDPEADSYDPTDTQVGIDDSEGKILKLIKDFRKASKNYFKINVVPAYAKNSNMSSDFDIILEVTDSKKLGENLYKIYLKNTWYQYQINYFTHVPNGVYKIRSIADCNWKDQKKINLFGNDYTFFLEISNWMKSYNPSQWEKCVPSSKITENKPIRDKISSKIFQKKDEKRKYYTLKDVISKDHHNQEIRVVCQFVDTFTSFEQALKKYDSKNNTEKTYETQDGEYIYSIHFAITDESLQGQLFNVYIYSYDKKGNQFLPGLNPQKIFGKNVLSFKEQYDNLMDRLLQESDINDVPIQLVLSPMTNGRDTIYRIIDTQLLI